MALDALYTASSALQTFSAQLDLIGNNLANLNTTGFKAQSANFQDLFYQTLSAGTAATSTLGTTNPEQVGSGVDIGSTDTNFTAGSVTPTGNPLDAAIQGNGFFVLSNGSADFYSRSGTFAVNSNGYLVDSNTGDLVQRYGSVGEGSATSPSFQTPGNLNIQIPYGASVPGIPTANVTLAGNIDSNTAVGGSFSTSIEVYDSLGNARALTATFTETAADTYSVSATISGGTVSFGGSPTATVTFDSSTGLLQSPASLTATLTGLPSAQSVNLNLGTVGSSNGITQFGSSTTVAATNQDGTGAGTLSTVSIDSSGIIQGIFSNGQTIPIAQLALANFSNPGGLSRIGNNYFQATPSSANPLVGTAGTAGTGSIEGSALEGSNVDISTEFTQLILAQNAYAVNARTITVANEVLQTTEALIPQA